MRDDIIERCALAAFNSIWRDDQHETPIERFSDVPDKGLWLEHARAVLAALKDATAEPSGETCQRIIIAAFKGQDVFALVHSEIFKGLEA